MADDESGASKPLAFVGTASTAEKGGGIAVYLPVDAAEFIGVKAKDRVLVFLDDHPDGKCVRLYSSNGPMAHFAGRLVKFRDENGNPRDQIDD